MLLALLHVSGCINIISRHPLYDPEKDRTFDSKLVGAWTARARTSETVSLEIKAGEHAAYVAITSDTDIQRKEQVVEQSPFDLVKFGSRRYVFPIATEQSEPSDVVGPIEPAHSYPVAKLKRRGDTLRVRILDANALLTFAQANAAQLPHEWRPEPGNSRMMKGTLILLCTREQMKDFLANHDEQLFPDDAELTFERVSKKP
jgi:hypothetical protein